MAKSSNAYVIGEGPESDREISGIRSSRFDLERQTARVPRVDLERLLAEERELAEVDEVDDTMMLPPSSRAGEDHGPRSQNTTLRLQAPTLPPGIPSPLGSDFPPPLAELTQVLKYTPVPIPEPAPVATFHIIREARDEARRTQRLVVAIWAFALTLAGGLGYFVATHG